MYSNELEHYGVPGMKWGRRRVRGNTPSTLRLTGPSIEGGSSTGSYNPNGFKSSSKKSRPKNAKYTDSNASSNPRPKKEKVKKEKAPKEPKMSSDKAKTGFTPKPDNAPKPDATPNSSSKINSGIKGAHDGIKSGKGLVDGATKFLDADRQKKHLGEVTAKSKTMTDEELKSTINRLSMEDRYVSIMEKRGSQEAKTDLHKTLEIVGEVAGYADTALSVYNAIESFRRG